MFFHCSHIISSPAIQNKTEQRGIFAVEKLADLPPPCLLGAGEGNPELPPSSNALILR